MIGRKYEFFGEPVYHFQLSVSSSTSSKENLLYDIFLENGTSVGIVEVKYKVQKAHIDKILAQKQKNFRIFFPEMKDYKLYMGIAGFSFESESEEYAMDNGLVVLKQKGKVVQVNASQMKAF